MLAMSGSGWIMTGGNTNSAVGGTGTTVGGSDGGTAAIVGV